MFMLLTAGKDRAEASYLAFALPSEWHLQENVQAVMAAGNDLMVTAIGTASS